MSALVILRRQYQRFTILTTQALVRSPKAMFGPVSTWMGGFADLMHGHFDKAVRFCCNVVGAMVM